MPSTVCQGDPLSGGDALHPQLLGSAEPLHLQLITRGLHPTALQ